MTTSLAVRELTPNVVEMAVMLAPIFKDSRLFGVATEAQAAAICLKGYELGLSLTASFELIHVIDSKPTISPRGALALILNSPLLENLEIKDESDSKGVPTACTVTMKRKNGFSYTARFSMEDAKRANLIKSGSGWEKYPANMLRARAIGFAEIDANGNVIDGEWKAAPTTTMTQQQPDADEETTQPPAITLQELVGQYGPEAVMQANGGRIPGTQDEIDLVAAALGA